jgi:hypothetical protein
MFADTKTHFGHDVTIIAVVSGLSSTLNIFPIHIDCPVLPFEQKPIIQCEVCRRRVGEEAQLHRCLQCLRKTCSFCRSLGSVPFCKDCRPRSYGSRSSPQQETCQHALTTPIVATDISLAQKIADISCTTVNTSCLGSFDAVSLHSITLHDSSSHRDDLRFTTIRSSRNFKADLGFTSFMHFCFQLCLVIGIFLINSLYSSEHDIRLSPTLIVKPPCLGAGGLVIVLFCWYIFLSCDDLHRDIWTISTALFHLIYWLFINFRSVQIYKVIGVSLTNSLYYPEHNNRFTLASVVKSPRLCVGGLVVVALSRYIFGLRADVHLVPLPTSTAHLRFADNNMTNLGCYSGFSIGTELSHVSEQSFCFPTESSWTLNVVKESRCNFLAIGQLWCFPSESSWTLNVVDEDCHPSFYEVSFGPPSYHITSQHALTTLSVATDIPISHNIKDISCSTGHTVPIFFDVAVQYRVTVMTCVLQI